MGIELLPMLLLAVVGLLAGWINTVAGAGSLLLLPALIFSGLPADSANATNRIAIIATTSAAVWGYRRAGVHVGRTDWVLTLAAMAGGALGAWIATLLSAANVTWAIIVAMAVMLMLSMSQAMGRAKQAADPKPTLPAPTLSMVAAFVGIGVYGGFLQAGLGVVVLLYLSIVHGVSLVASNVVKSLAVLGLTLVALLVFGLRGEQIDWPRGAVLALGSGVGGALGARTSLKLGDRFIRVTVAMAVVASMLKLVWDQVWG